MNTTTAEEGTLLSESSSTIRKVVTDSRMCTDTKVLVPDEGIAPEYRNGKINQITCSNPCNYAEEAEPSIFSHDRERIPKGFYYIAADIATIRHCPVFDVILKEPKESFLPDDERAAAIVEQCLYPYGAEFAEDRIKATLLSVFRHAFASLEDGNSLSDMKGFLQFALVNSLGCQTIPYSDDTLPIFEALFCAMDMVILKLRSADEICLADKQAARYSGIASWAESIISYTRKTKHSLEHASLYQIILCGWEVLKDMPCTYSALTSLVLLQESFENMAQARYELLGLLKMSTFA